jgi:minor histocompatibility antigen H13
MSVGSIFVGSLKSIKVRESGDSDKIESVGTKDAMKFPLVASATLLGIYVVVKLINKDLIGLLLSGYFTLIGVVCINVYISQAIKPFGLVKEIKDYKYSFAVPYFDTIDIEFTNLDFFSFPFAAAIGLAYFVTKHWILNNVMGLLFSVYGIEHVSINSYTVGAIMLVGLFFYDIFWVFGTDVMVTVAKNIDAPIKLMFPKGWGADGIPEFSMLGLGDIVIPGIFIALCIRFEAAQGIKKDKANKFPTPIFNATMFGYLLGIGVTMFIMYTFDSAQPALLYLVPAVLITSFA